MAEDQSRYRDKSRYRLWVFGMPPTHKADTCMGEGCIGGAYY